MQQCGFAAGDNFIVFDRQPKPFEFVDRSGTIIAGGIRQNTDCATTFAKLVQPAVCTGNHRFANIQHAECIENERVDVVGNI